MVKRVAHIQDNSCAQGLPSMLTRSTFAKVNCEVADIASFSSASIHTLIPHLIGFLGMYCLKNTLPLYFTIVSSCSAHLLAWNVLFQKRVLAHVKYWPNFV